MSGTPNQAQIFSQWTAASDVLETIRAAGAGMAAASGEFDTLEQALHGTFTPELASNIASIRASLGDLVSSDLAFSMLEPILREYALNVVAVANAQGNDDIAGVMEAIYDYMHANTIYVLERNLTYGSPSSVTGTGDGTIYRCTTDRRGYAMEACHPETKLFRCVNDQNTGTKEHAEQFEIIGEPQGLQDGLIDSYGTGNSFSSRLTCLHAGSGTGGSLLNNSSFSTYSASASPKFSKWTESAGGASIAQDTSNTYRSHPNASSDAALQITGGAGTVTLKQTLANMRTSSLSRDVPYYCRIMVNKTVGTAVGGTVTLRLGSVSVSSTIAGLGSNWQELRIGSSTATDVWLENFNEDPFDIEIEWSSSTSGTLLVDDVILAPMTEVDGTFFVVVGGTTPFLVEDYMTVADSGGAAGTGINQYWLWRAGLGYLPHDPTPTLTEPT